MRSLRPFSQLILIGTMLSAPGLHAQAPERCATDVVRQRLIEENPDLLHEEAAYEHGLQALLQAKALNREGSDTTTYIIPIVFHILYDPTTGSDAHNISDAQIYSAMNILNQDYAKLNPDTVQVCCGFLSRAANVHVQFQLATKDPFGNCTNGIDRITTQRSTLAQNYSKLHPWFRDHYLNVWVANTIGSVADFGVSGYAMFPADVQDPNGALIDGVMMLNTYCGDIGTSSPGSSRTLTHEIGHYLNLQHVWGNGPVATTCGDDGVADTPITKGWQFCPSPVQSMVCDPDSSENYQNFMDYSFCEHMFTKGQRDRMRATLESPVSGRNRLWQDINHQYTGTAGNELTCGPEADFHTLDNFVCTGTAVRFKDNSKHSTPTAWAWTFEGGNPATSTEQNPVVSFDEPGYHAVTLTAGNDLGSGTITKYTSFMVGADYSQVNGLLTEPFNSNSDFQRWPIVNPEGNASSWRWNEQVGHNAPGSALLNGSNTYTLIQDGFAPNEFHDKDILATPMLDLRFVQNLSVSFWYAYSTQTGNPSQMKENLKVYASTSCGKNWNPILTINGANLVTAGVQSPGYVPLADEWRQATFTLSSLYAKNNVRLKFEYSSGLASNDLYIDDVNITGSNAVGIDETARNGGMSLMPNPAGNNLTVTLDLAGAPNATLTFLDMTGRPLYSQAVNSSEEQLQFDLDKMGITSGVYLVCLKHADGQRVERLVVR